MFCESRQMYVCMYNNWILVHFVRERTRTNFFAVIRKKLQCCNAIKYSNRTTLDNDLRILASACNHRVPSDRADFQQIIEDYRNKVNSVKSVQNFILHDIYGNRSVLQKQSVSHHYTSPITMHISMPHSPLTMELEVQYHTCITEPQVLVSKLGHHICNTQL